MTTTLYDRDFDAWAQQQAEALRAKAWNQLDIAHLAEEIEELRKSEGRPSAANYGLSSVTC